MASCIWHEAPETWYLQLIDAVVFSHLWKGKIPSRILLPIHSALLAGKSCALDPFL